MNFEIYSEVRAVLSENVINGISGCVEDALKKCIYTANVETIAKENGMQYILSGTLDDIITARIKLQDLLDSLTIIKSAGESDSTTTLITNENRAIVDAESSSNPKEIESDSSSVLEQNESENMFSNGQVVNNNEVYSGKKYCLKTSSKKLRFFLRERPRSQRIKSARLAYYNRTLKLKQSIGNKLLKSLELDKDDSDSLIKNLEQMQLCTENNSDFDSAEIEVSTQKETLSQKKAKDYEAVSPYKHFCELCSFKTKRSSHFAKHMAIHEKVNTLYRCSQCSFTSVRLSHLRRHEMTHSTTVHTCTQCHYKTDDMKFLLRHIRLKHCGSHSKKNSSIILNCPHCSYQTTKQHYYDRHQRMHCSKNRSLLHQCEQCRYKTHRKEHFVRHVNNVHGNKRPYLCHLCGKAFKRGDALQQHHQTHAEMKITEGTNFKCVICEKSFRSQSHLFEHQAVHSEVRSFLCEICGASFKTRSVQRKHVLTIHRNPRAYSCESCNKRFNTLYALKRHQKVHNGKSQPEQESEVDSEEVAGSFVESSTSGELKPLYGETTTNDVNISSITALQVAPPPPDSLTVDITTLPMQETVVSGAEIIHHITPAFLQTSETATALLYLTNGLTQF